MDFRYSGLGDLTMMGQWMALGTDPSRGSVALMAGVKLPTGRKNVTAIDGEQPEPPARPGTGSTDGLVGIHLMRPIRLPSATAATAPLFATIQGRFNGRGTDEYRVGDELQVSVGGTCPVGERFDLLSQLNLRVRGKDDVGQTDALRDNTGGTWLYLSPGVRVHTSSLLAVYAYAQVPVYERVNRIQLVSPVHLMIGTSYAFGR